jgi:hypothetical protein
MPVPTHRAPLLPEEAEPVLKESRPLVPFRPEFKLRINTVPDVVVVPSPVLSMMEPPV